MYLNKEFSNEYNYIFENFNILKIDNLSIENNNNNDIIDLCLLNFRQPTLLRENLRLVKKYFKDLYNYTIFDVYYDETTLIENSSICKDFGFSYVCFDILPKYKNIWLCDRLGLKMDCMLRYVKSRKSKYIGYIQQDIYFIKDFMCMDDLIKNKCYGRCLESKDFWYLWNGFSFFDVDYFEDLDFFPNSPGSLKYKADRPNYENGGGNYYLYFRNRYKKEQFIGMNSGYSIYINGDKSTNPYSDDIKDVICESMRNESLIHGLAVSNWCNRDGIDIKNLKLLELLKRY